ncbi:hypothetical protein [Nonomuraea sp. NPDC050786]|uniref:hypothetical protein n=1 Tax=Nonomuraea sp. NPDC050786 TaxID=3154840 RepID=UPI0033DEE4D8
MEINMESTPSQKRSHRSIALAVALAAVAFAGTACGSGEEPGKTGASLLSQADSATPPQHNNPNETWSKADKLKYAACMRSNGVPSFPDPDTSGAFKLDDNDSNTPQFKKAEEACKQHRPQNIPSMTSSKTGGS